ncbi:MAG: acyl carrier protein [Thermoguttaceae bacterium]|jgi:acyl carrier protein
MMLEERLANLFEKTFGLEKERFSIDMQPEDVPNWDSIGHMNLIMYMEQEFNQHFEVDDIMEMSSPAKILEILKSKGVSE